MSEAWQLELLNKLGQQQQQNLCSHHNQIHFQHHYFKSLKQVILKDTSD